MLLLVLLLLVLFAVVGDVVVLYDRGGHQVWLVGLMQLVMMTMVQLGLMVGRRLGMHSVVGEDVVVQQWVLEVAVVQRSILQVGQVKVHHFVLDDRDRGGQGLRLKARDRLVQLYVTLVNVLMVDGLDITGLNWGRY